MTEEKRNALERELVTSSMDNTLTEQRFNELLDALLPTVAHSPEAAGTLTGFGERIWRERRIARERSVQAA